MLGHRRTCDQGFTLIELLIVILIIGILAAIAIPSFLGQRDKAMDANAKHDARTLVTHMEACYQAANGFTGCSAQLTRAETGMPIGNGPGEVSVTAEQENGYAITAVSHADANGVNHRFTIVHNIGGVFARECSPGGEGGCPSDGTW